MRSMVFRAVLVVFSLLLITSAANAAGGNGSILAISIRNGANHATVDFTGVTGSHPGTCFGVTYSAPYSQFGFDISTTKGKALLSLLESAFLAGKTIGFGGNGTSCITVETGVNVEILQIATMPGT